MDMIASQCEPEQHWPQPDTAGHSIEPGRQGVLYMI